MSEKYDGRAKAHQKEKELRNKLASNSLASPPKLVSIIVGHDKGALFYQKMKKEAGERVGIDLEIYTLPPTVPVEAVEKIIEKLNNDTSVNGIMIQLPLPEHFSTEDRLGLIDLILPEKDVDGMSEDSSLVAPVVLAAMDSFQETEVFKDNPCKIAIVGANGFVGKKLSNELEKLENCEVFGVDLDTNDIASVTKNADVVFSATGQPEVIKADMIKNGSVLIDIGAPKPEFEEACYEKASFYTPVPGGIGPMTIYYLMENLTVSI